MPVRTTSRRFSSRMRIRITTRPSRIFPKATVYAMKREVPVAQGKEEYGSTFSAVTGKFNPHPFEIGIRSTTAKK